MNFLAIAIATIGMSFLGMLWYGPVFGPRWITAMGWSSKDLAKAQKQAMWPRFGLNMLAAGVMMVVLANLIYALTITNAGIGALFGILVWVGFIATSSLSGVLWEGYSPVAYAIYNGYALVGLALGGAIIAAW